jgi:hypothetical protein
MPPEGISGLGILAVGIFFMVGLVPLARVRGSESTLRRGRDKSGSGTS